LPSLPARVAEKMVEEQANLPHLDDSSLEILTQRLQRLEDAIASLQDTRGLEDRVFERVRQNIHTRPAEPEARASERIVDRKKLPLPMLSNLLTPPAAVKETSAPATGPALGGLPPVVVVREGLFIVDVWHELRATLRMFVDMRYRMGWLNRLLIFGLLIAILTSHVWLPGASYWEGIWIIGPMLDKIVCLLLGFFLFKILSREARKYMQAREQEGYRR
jgi:hypothetical protein